MTSQVADDVTNPCLPGATYLYRGGAYTYMQPVYGPDAMRGVANIVKLNDQERQRLYQFVGPKTYSLNVSLLLALDCC